MRRALALAAVSLACPALGEAAVRFYSVPPCRVLDTREASHGPALAAGEARSIPLAGRCGTPPTATTFAANVTVTGSAAPGHLILYRAGEAEPNASTINFRSAQTRANNALISVGAGGSFVVRAGVSSGTVHLLVDVNGYFDDTANNQPPFVKVGGDRSLSLPSTLTLAATVTDDGMPAPLSLSWSVAAGPGVSWSSATSATTTVTFPQPGAYVLRLTASDSALASTADVNVTVRAPADAYRFLWQAAWGPTDAEASRVAILGRAAWIDDQVRQPHSTYPSLPQLPDSVPSTCTGNCSRDNYSLYLTQRHFFTSALHAPDQLRQRVAFALHKILVVSGLDVSRPSRYHPYLQSLTRNALGSYRQLLEEITLNPAMGEYLDMRRSTRSRPNENYAREILQLFSVGVDRLDPEGTVLLDTEGRPLPTYDQDEIDGFTKVFTGWQLATAPSGTTNYGEPMVVNGGNHDATDKRLLDGVVLPGTSSPATAEQANADLEAALDNIVAHPNTAPFLSRGLIQQLVTSNPSPAYVGRIAAVFANDGLGQRGNLAAVVKAILLDDEARTPPTTSEVEQGKLKEPVLFASGLLRALEARSADGSGPSDGYLNAWTTQMGQDVFRPPSVFSYFAPDNGLPGHADLLGPEFGIFTASSAVRRTNFVNEVVYRGLATSTNAPAGTSLGLSSLFAWAGDPGALADELDRRLLNGTMSPAMRTEIVAAVSAVSVRDLPGRVRQGVYLVATSQQFQVQR